METDKNSRLLYLYEALICGESLQKKEAAARFGVNERSIQRDIDCLRNFFAGQNPPREIPHLRGAAGSMQDSVGQPLHAEGGNGGDSG